MITKYLQLCNFLKKVACLAPTGTPLAQLWLRSGMASPQQVSEGGPIPAQEGGVIRGECRLIMPTVIGTNSCPHEDDPGPHQGTNQSHNAPPLEAPLHPQVVTMRTKPPSHQWANLSRGEQASRRHRSVSQRLTEQWFTKVRSKTALLIKKITNCNARQQGEYSWQTKRTEVRDDGVAKGQETCTIMAYHWASAQQPARGDSKKSEKYKEGLSVPERIETHSVFHSMTFSGPFASLQRHSCQHILHQNKLNFNSNFSK